MKKPPLLSICIPTYNGGLYFKEAISKIVPYIDERYELVISDDCSTDGTYEFAKKISDSNQLVIVHKNKNNLGMDRNFHNAVRLAKGKYIWFCGQDDYLGGEIINKVAEILSGLNLAVLNLNFSQYDHDMKSCIMESFFDRASFKNNEMVDNELIVFNNPLEYFKKFTQPPSFLPSVVMLREFWNDVDASQFYGTHFVQVGLVLLNLNKGKIGAFTKPLIKGRIPNDQWQSNGAKLFDIMTGDILAKRIAFDKNPSLPKHILVRDIKKYTLNFIFLIATCRDRGLKTNQIKISALKKIYADGPLFRYYIRPISNISPSVLNFIVMPLKFIKRLLLRIPSIEGLRG